MEAVIFLVKPLPIHKVCQLFKHQANWSFGDKQNGWFGCHMILFHWPKKSLFAEHWKYFKNNANLHLGKPKLRASNTLTWIDHDLLSHGFGLGLTVNYSQKSSSKNGSFFVYILCSKKYRITGLWREGFLNMPYARRICLHGNYSTIHKWTISWFAKHGSPIS